VLALTELREFIRGLHPAVLNDRGPRRGAVRPGARARCRSGCGGRAEPAAPSVEAVAYFIVSEALANVASTPRPPGPR
jgi:signal transduction histidine kinase